MKQLKTLFLMHNKIAAKTNFIKFKGNRDNLKRLFPFMYKQY